MNHRSTGTRFAIPPAATATVPSTTMTVAVIRLVGAKYALVVIGELTMQRDDDRGGIGGADQVPAGETGRVADRHLAAGRPLCLSGVGHGTKVAR